MKETLPDESGPDQFVQKPIWANVHPCSKNFEAILQGRGGASVGNLTFKNCKRVSSIEKFQYRKRLNIDTVTGNKKFFHENAHLQEFAKRGLAPGYASEAFAKHAAALKEQQEELKRQKEDKKNKTTDKSKTQHKWETKKFHGLHDRFPPGEAWYDSNHVIGQLGYAKNTQSQGTFYSSAQFSTVNNRNRSSMNPS